MKVNASVDFTVSASGINALTAHGGLVDAYIMKLAKSTERIAQSTAPVAEGTLRDSIRSERYATMRSAWIVVADTPYAAAVSLGTKPHEIVPNKAKVLRFPTKGGTVVYTTRVNHPGTQPNPYLTNALRLAVRR